MRMPWNIVGHEEQLQKIEQEIESSNLAHAYLFSGPRQVGKFRIARKLALLLQCPQKACQTCKVCKSILAGVHPDTFLFKDEGEPLGIDQIRDLIARAHLVAQSPYRIFVIENIERMPLPAQNSFLKTLEEPPGKTLFLLTSSRVNEVLPTILSRVRRTDFFNVDSETLRTFLKKEFPGHRDMDEVINMAQGRPGLAIALMKNAEILAEQRQMYGTIERFLKHNNLAEKFMFVESLAEEGAGEKPMEFFFDAFTRFLRKLLFEYYEQPDHALRVRWNLLDLTRLFDSLEKTRFLILQNANQRLALENLMIATEV